MEKQDLINFLTKFRWIDKYATFSKILPAAVQTAPAQKEIVNGILDACAYDLLQLLNQQAKPTKTLIKQVLSKYMDELALASVSTADKDFGYELFWYVGEKAGIDLRRSSDAKIWGYWKVESGKVKTVGSVRRKKEKVSG